MIKTFLHCGLQRPLSQRQGRPNYPKASTVIYRALADVILLIHAAFVIFVTVGGVLVLYKRALMPWHLTALAWGVLIISMGWICPLTPLENMLRQLAGQEGYPGGFIEHYVFRLIYPSGLTRGIQIGLAAGLLIVNAGIYSWIYARRAKRSK